MNRTENIIAALAPFLRKNCEGAAADPDNMDDEARERAVAATFGFDSEILAARMAADNDYLFELSRILIDGLHRSFVYLHKHITCDLIDVEEDGNEDGEPSEDIKNCCLSALDGYVSAISSGIEYIVKNSLTSKTFILAYNKLKVNKY